MQNEIEIIAKNIFPANGIEMEKAKNKWNSIAKPLKSLGALEEAVIKMAGIFGAERVNADKTALVVMCGDHGVVSEGVTQTGQEVTAAVMKNFEAGKTVSSIMAAVCGTDVFAVDIGVNSDCEHENMLQPGRICGMKIGRGTKNIAICDAMTHEQCRDAIACGIEVVRELKTRGYDMIASGEMGIGNTTSASAIVSAITGKDAKVTTGKGAGLSENMFLKKIETVKKSVDRFKKRNKESFDGFEVLKALGGYDIAAMTGLFLGGGIYKVPIIIDGFISAAAALCAVNINKNVKDYVLASHVSKEPYGIDVMNDLGLDSVINCGMCLGEGTGAVAAIPLFKMAVNVYNDMVTFESMKIEKYVDYEKEEKI